MFLSIFISTLIWLSLVSGRAIEIPRTLLPRSTARPSVYALEVPRADPLFIVGREPSTLLTLPPVLGRSIFEPNSTAGLNATDAQLVALSVQKLNSIWFMGQMNVKQGTNCTVGGERVPVGYTACSIDSKGSNVVVCGATGKWMYNSCTPPDSPLVPSDLNPSKPFICATTIKEFGFAQDKGFTVPQTGCVSPNDICETRKALHDASSGQITINGGLTGHEDKEMATHTPKCDVYGNPLTSEATTSSSSAGVGSSSEGSIASKPTLTTVLSTDAGGGQHHTTVMTVTSTVSSSKS